MGLGRKLGQVRPERRRQRGVVAVEIMLSLPVIIVAFSGAIFVTTYMKKRAQVEQLLSDTFRLCSRTMEPVAAIDCVEQGLRTSPRAALCEPMEITVEVLERGEVYAGDELFNEVPINLDILTALVSCMPDISVPLLNIDALAFTSQVAMPIRIGTDLLP